MASCRTCGVEMAHPKKRGMQRTTCSTACREQLKKVHQINYRSKPEYVDVRWTSTLKRKYGITPDDYVLMLIEQGGLCAICRQPEVRGIRGRSFSVLCVDHDHTTGKVRGLLCHGCNHGIGSLAENIDRMKSAIEYVEKHHG